MEINIQPILETETALLYPLQHKDFDELFATASDPKIWEQHPNKNRWRKEVFEIFFEGAIESRGAFKIIDKASNTIIGCTRFYDYQPEKSTILIGYTFYNKNSWGKGINSAVKKSMLEYIFQFVSTVVFHVGSTNLRSQIAMNRLNIKKVDEEEVAYFGEPSKLNFVYKITKDDWNLRKNSTKI
jgi:RimJ/RimL family protein N-acetyltransferase